MVVDETSLEETAPNARTGAGAPAPEKPDWRRLAEDAYRTSTTFVDSYLRAEWEKSLKQWQGQHSNDSKYMSDAYKGRSKLFRPKTRAAVRANEASTATAYFATADVVNIEPEDDSDPRQRVTAELLKNLVQYRLTNNIPWFLILMGAAQDAHVIGAVVSHQCWRYDGDRDEPEIEIIPIENLRISPAAKWHDPINTSPYVIWLIPMYLHQVRERMGPDGGGKTGKPWNKVEDGDLLSASKPYSDQTRLTRERREDSTTQEGSPTDFSIVWVRMVILRWAGEEWLYYTAGSEHMLSDPVPLRTEYLHGMRPFVMGIANLETHKIYPSSLPAITRDVQTEINHIANSRIDNVLFVLNKRYFVDRGAQVDLRSLTRNVPGSVTLMNDPKNDVLIQSTPDVTNSAFGEQDRLNLDFDDLAGGLSGSSVQSNRQLNETVGGINALAQAGNVITEYMLRLFNETWTEPVLKQLVKLEQHYETDAEVLALAGKKAPSLQALNAPVTLNDAMLQGSVRVQVNVGVGSTNPQTQVERFFGGLNSLAQILGPEAQKKLNLEEIVAEAFGKLGYRDGKRFFNFEEQEDPQVAQLTQMVQELQQKLAQKMSPEMEAAEIRKLDAQTELTKNDAVAKAVGALYSAMQAAQVAATTPGTMPVADAMLGSSGWEDRNGPPIAPPYSGGPVAVPNVPQNTSPMFPAPPPSPLRGIETARPDSVAAA